METDKPISQRILNAIFQQGASNRIQLADLLQVLIPPSNDSVEERSKYVEAAAQIFVQLREDFKGLRRIDPGTEDEYMMSGIDGILDQHFGPRPQAKL